MVGRGVSGVLVVVGGAVCMEVLGLQDERVRRGRVRVGARVRAILIGFEPCGGVREGFFCWQRRGRGGEGYCSGKRGRKGSRVGVSDWGLAALFLTLW